MVLSTVAIIKSSSLDIPVLLRIGSVWLGLLWVPGTPEKLLTFGIAMGLHIWHDYIQGDTSFFCMLSGCNVEELPMR